MRAIIADRPVAAVRRLHVLVLAAGASRRLGRSKAQLKLNGVALVQRQCRHARAARPAGIIVVTGARAAATAHAAHDARAPRVRIVRNRAWRTGQSSSLRAGLRALPRSATHALVVAVDQWQLDDRCYARLAGRAGRTPVCASYAGRRGIPVVFPRQWFARLAGLSGDGGARALLVEAAVRDLALAQAADDLDTPADAARARRLALRGAGAALRPRRSS